jgi:hypothetical protein
MKKLLHSFLIFLLIFSASVEALEIDLELKNSYSVGERVLFNYTILSDTDQQIIFTPYIFCSNAPLALVEEEKINLVADELHTGTYAIFTVTEEIEPQTCTAYVQILSPVQMTEQKNFTIDTSPSFSLQLDSCKKQFCTEKSKVFVRGEDIYLDYSSDVDNPSITATLTYPDGTTRTLTLPTSTRAEQIGTYTLEVTASKQGYKDAETRTQFAVIEQEAGIPYVSVCNLNGVCDNDENYQNCPQDCEKPWFDWTYLAYAAVIVVIIVVVLIIIIKLASSRKKTQPEYSDTGYYTRTQ